MASVATAAPEAPQDDLSGRLRDLFARTVVPTPYPVSDKILVTPPTKAAWLELDRLRHEKMAGQLYLASAMQQTGPDAPSMEDLGELSKVINDADTAYDKLFFGDHHDAVKELSGGWQPAHWQAFCDDIKNHFLGRGPATGECPHCGQVIDADLAGKDSAPST